MGRLRGALAAYEHAPADFDTLAGLGDLLHDMERYPHAVSIYDGALRIRQDDRPYTAIAAGRCRICGAWTKPALLAMPALTLEI